MKTIISIITIISGLLISSCEKHDLVEKPNVILIMADDMGYECLSSNGSTSYQTPILDSLAAKGFRFENCYSQPLCTPSRVKIMTGKYNYRNYDYFGHLHPDEYTFGNIMKEGGYATCIAGKWQLNGLAYKDKIPYWNDNMSPVKFGFDEYCLWQLTKQKKVGERYANPLVEQNGRILDRNVDDYGPDIFAEFLLDFIDRKQDVPFFIYYPMVLVHDPFVPTPDSESWQDREKRYEKDAKYFKDMVAYCDKIVGRIAAKLRDLDLDTNTLLIFTADNGTNRSITSLTQSGSVTGGKGKTLDAGIHVPLIINWPQMIKNTAVRQELIEFSDFFPTLADIVDSNAKNDGQSFLPLLTGNVYKARTSVFIHYDPRWGKFVNSWRNQFVNTSEYKLYQDGSFYHFTKDLLEENPLADDDLSAMQKDIRRRLNAELAKHPTWE
jgi:arylsulfatase A